MSKEENNHRVIVNQTDNNNHPPQEASDFHIVSDHSAAHVIHINNSINVNDGHPSPVTGVPVILPVAVAPEKPRSRLFCGIGVGWFLFIIGWFLCGIPWYAGAIVLLCSRGRDPRERPGYIACTIFAIIISVVAIVSVAKGK